MAGLNDELAKTECAAIKTALTDCKGNIRAAAEQLGIGQSTMQDKIRRIYPELGEHADRIKKRNGYSRRGRPAKRDGKLSKSQMRRAWRQHKTIAATARALGKPAATVRMVLIEYGYYQPPSEAE